MGLITVLSELCWSVYQRRCMHASSLQISLICVSSFISLRLIHSLCFPTSFPSLLCLLQLSQWSSLDLIPSPQPGLSSLFEKPNLCGIYSEDKLALNDAQHKAFLTLTEEGVEGAAATSLAYSRSFPTFSALRPFVLLLWNDRANVPLFIGRVTDPWEKEWKRTRSECIGSKPKYGEWRQS